MGYPQAFIDYLIFFHGERDFFECHEVLEEYWKSKEGAKEKVWVGFIQLAVALYHFRRSNYEGAKRMITSAQKLLEKEKTRVTDLGVNKEQLLIDLSEIRKNIEDKSPYQDYNIPIQDQTLLELCTDHCKLHKLEWCTSSDFNNNYLINKHSLRNREDVINERAKQQKIKNRIMSKLKKED
ncbi:DUF309 domain-containing protein [Alkalihalobacillus sp. BA299]|uniref:DUF309 domain-containing protein n=1 Tax=Alkalihalobacillus sp. BA299 TaxID=2815938 RepID=UPI001ADCA973|nr:DUF309 domain-containing protein [Alkalihalobacillus sp. BA299]